MRFHTSKICLITVSFLITFSLIYGQNEQASGSDLVPIDIKLPKPMFIGTPQNMQVPNLEKPLGKPIYSSVRLRKSVNPVSQAESTVKRDCLKSSPKISPKVRHLLRSILPPSLEGKKRVLLSSSSVNCSMGLSIWLSARSKAESSGFSKLK